MTVQDEEYPDLDLNSAKSHQEYLSIQDRQVFRKILDGKISEDEFVGLRLKERDILHKEATRDPLTGFLRLGAFIQGLKPLYATLEKDDSSHKTGVVVFVNGSNLYEINHQINHSAGNKAILSLAEIIADNVNMVIPKGFHAKDLICRIRGDEFVVLLPLSLEESLIVAETLRSQSQDVLIKSPSQSEVCFNITLKISLIPYQSGTTPDHLFFNNTCLDTSSESILSVLRNKIDNIIFMLGNIRQSNPSAIMVEVKDTDRAKEIIKFSLDHKIQVLVTANGQPVSLV